MVCSLEFYMLFRYFRKNLINAGILGVPDGFYILRNKVLPVNSDDICKKLDLICGLEFYIYSHFFTQKN